MNQLRAIYTDLVDKRLWPVAVALVLALVAVPVLLAKPAAEPPTPATPALGAKAAPPLTQYASDVAPADGPVPGSAKNPFRQQHVPRQMASTPADIGPATAGSGAVTDFGSGSGSLPDTGGGGGSVTVPSGSGGAPPAPAPPAVTRLRVKFGPSSGRRVTRDIVSGAPLPTANNPLLVYLGLENGKPKFLVSSDAQPEGDGKCEPDKTICSELELEPGETEFFDVTGPGGTVQYQLDVLKVVKP